MVFKIAVAQLNFTTGDSAGNARRIIDAARAAHAQGASLLLTPQWSVCGFLAEDASLRPSFIAACDEAVAAIVRESAGLQGMTIVVGHPAGQTQRASAASVIREGRVIETCARPLPPAQGHCVFQAADVRVGLVVGADAGLQGQAQRARQAGAELLALIDAAPFHIGGDDEREAMLGQCARAAGLPLVRAHMVGGQGEAVFEGRSLAFGADGKLAGRARGFAEQTFYVDVARADTGLRLAADTAPARGRDADLWDALVMGLRDYVRKNGFKSVLLGLSGGIDSALVLALAVDALGKEQIRTVMMPSPYTAGISLEDAREMARRLGVRHDEISIRPEFESFKQSLAPLFGGKPEDTTEENLQSRIRGVMLMALSNKHGHLLLTTGNKSECATGYCTLYGDTCGGFAPIKDVLKTTVFRLARWRNAHDPHGGGADPIPERIITRAPSAELRPGQKDQDSLPPYELLDAIIEGYIERGMGIAELAASGFSRDAVEQMARLFKASEYKRLQSAPGTRVTRRGLELSYG
ncbi:MAG: NAD+ synthase [Desulfovibrionaceae bacterium]|jgi:NAD+ synthase (glutamine-hydrolysing)|nr:NAD+ synthase [Desulfovibrionaceae bacterium]